MGRGKKEREEYCFLSAGQCGGVESYSTVHPPNSQLSSFALPFTEYLLTILVRVFVCAMVCWYAGLHVTCPPPVVGCRSCSLVIGPSTPREV